MVREPFQKALLTGVAWRTVEVSAHARSFLLKTEAYKGIQQLEGPSMFANDDCRCSRLSIIPYQPCPSRLATYAHASLMTNRLPIAEVITIQAMEP